MATKSVLLEIVGSADASFELNTMALESAAEATSQSEQALNSIGASGITLDPAIAPIPMFIGPENTFDLESMSEFESLSTGPKKINPKGKSLVVAAEVETNRIAELEERKDVIVWQNSQLTLFPATSQVQPSAGPTDCWPFRAGVTIEEIRARLGLQSIFSDGFRGSDIVVGIIDEGIHGGTYPVIGGYSRPNSPVRPGAAPVTSHGSMCAADVLIAAPNAKFYDYPFLGVPNSGGALQMFQAVLDSRRANGTPHITNNSYGFTGVPDRAALPNHEIHDRNHPIHRKVREVVAAGVACFFAAGNCGQQCPSGNCHASGVGPGCSIHASNSLAEVITVAAVNSMRQRIGYSSQGPGMFERNKPDIASYSHIFANYGPGRPAGTAQPFDSGTSAATPVAAGVAALLLSAFPQLKPQQIKDILIRSAAQATSQAGWNADFGHGVIDAGAAYQLARTMV